jgi:thioredoxin 1
VSSSTVLQVSDKTFQSEVLDHPGAVLLDVWAVWCGPCRLIDPLLDWAAETYADQLRVVKLEADSNPFTRDLYRIQGLPTLILIHGGQEVARHEGALAKPQLQAFLDAHL